MARFQLSSGSDLVSPVSPSSSVFSITGSTTSKLTKEDDDEEDEELMDFVDVKIEPEDEENSSDHLYSSRSSSSTGYQNLEPVASSSSSFSSWTGNDGDPATRCTLCPPPNQFDTVGDFNKHLLSHFIRYTQTGSRRSRPKCSICGKILRALSTSHIQSHLIKKDGPREKPTIVQKPTPKPNLDLVQYQVVEESTNKIWHACPICSKKYNRGSQCFREHLTICELKKTQKLAEEKEAEERAKMSQVSDTSDDEEDDDEGQQPKNQKIPICSLCESSFDTPAELTVHLLEHAKISRDGQSYMCPVCKWNFKNIKMSFKAHLRFHSGEAQYMCPVCKDAFIRPGDLQTHLDKHKPNWRYRCVYCPRFFPMKAQLEIHSQETHDKELYPCTLLDCEVTMESAEKLADHMTTTTSHSKQRFCSECDAKFQDKRNLKTHKLLHLARSPLFKCGLCQTSYLRHTTYATHCKLPHDIKCFECPALLVSRNQLISHYSKCHLTKKFLIYNCPFCKEPSYQLASLVDHILQCPSRGE